ncbi:MAG: MATE family efflux transporter [Pseudomonadales bacterium]
MPAPPDTMPAGHSQQPPRAPLLDGAFRREARTLLRLGGPMMATQMCIMGMGFIDTAMAGHYDAVDLAGVALGGSVLWPVFMLLTGMNMALTPMIAQLDGSGRRGESGALTRQGLWIAAAAALLAILLLGNARLLFDLAGVDAGAAAIAERYLDAVCWGLPASYLYVTLRYMSEGLGKTQPPMLIAVLALPLNALLNWMFIYGHFGAPALGGEGCGWATAAVWWAQLLIMLGVVRLPYFRATGLLDRLDPPTAAQVAAILRLGVPIGLTVFVEMMLFSVINFLVAEFGVVQLAAHSIAGNVNWATYVIPMSLGSAASIRIGYLIGSDDLAGARTVVRTAVTLSVGYALVVSALLIAARRLVAGIYTDDPAVIALAANLMLFIAVYQLLDDTQATMTGALRGFKDTRMPMVYSLLGWWLLALPLGVVLGLGSFGLPRLEVYGFWIGLTVGLAIVATLIGTRLHRTSSSDLRIRRLAAAGV